MNVREEVVDIAGLETVVVGDVAEARFVVVLLHGFAMQPADLAPFAHALGVPGLFLFPRGPFAASIEPGVEQGRAWWPIDPMARRAALERGPRDFAGEHPAGLPTARAMLGRFLDELDGFGGGPGPRPLVLGGFSQGGMLACDTFLRSPRPLAALALLSASRICFDEWPVLLAGWGRWPFPYPHVLASHGSGDRDLAFSAGVALRDCLVAAGAEVTWVPFDGGHETPLVVWRRLRKVLLTVAG